MRKFTGEIVVSHPSGLGKARVESALGRGRRRQRVRIGPRTGVLVRFWRFLQLGIGEDENCLVLDLASIEIP